MTRSDGPHEEDTSGVLRAVGSLLVALSGGSDHEVEQLLDEVRERTSPPPRRPVEPKAPAERSGAADLDDVDFIIEDARERAQRIIDESTDRARALLRSDLRSVPGIDPRAFDDLRFTTRGLATDMRNVQDRLSRIESLLLNAAITVSPQPSAPPAERDRPSPPEPARASPLPVAPERPAEASPQPPREPEAPAAPERSYGAIPPRGREGVPTTPDVPSAPPMPGVESSSPGRTADPPGWTTDAEGIATFLPSDGVITLRVAPVAGFQGLMRVHDALGRLPAVRHASVEAYSQGEARLLVELAEVADSEEIAAELGAVLDEPAAVRSASRERRELSITLR